MAKNNVFFTSDLHLGHANILKYSNRPFRTIEEHDEALVVNWNAKVRSSDTVYIVGDVSFHKPDKTNRLLDRMHGQKILVKGNHDKNFDQRRFASVHDMLTVKVEDPDTRDGVQRIVLLHYCMKVWDKSHYGTWHLHGHSHGSLKDDPNALSIDVGVDCHNYYPISYQEVKAIMATKTFKPIDHHGAKGDGY